MPDPRIRVLLVDDHPTFLKGLTAILEPEPDMEVVGWATTGAEALCRFRETMPDVTIMDIGLGRDMNGIQATQAIRRESLPKARVLILTMHAEQDRIHRALEAGAATYLLKDVLGDRLVETIREVRAGGGPVPPEVGRKLADRLLQASLTPRELEVLRLVAEGLRNKEIAGRLEIGEQTVMSHVKAIFGKLGVNDRTKAVTVALQRGIIDIDE